MQLGIWSVESWIRTKKASLVLWSILVFMWTDNYPMEPVNEKFVAKLVQQLIKQTFTANWLLFFDWWWKKMEYRNGQYFQKVSMTGKDWRGKSDQKLSFNFMRHSWGYIFLTLFDGLHIPIKNANLLKSFWNNWKKKLLARFDQTQKH